MTYEEIIQQPGNMIEPKVYYWHRIDPLITPRLVTIDRDDIKLIHPHFNTDIIGTIMRGMEVELAVQLPTDTQIYVENKAIYGTYNATKNFGYFWVKDETYNADTKTYTYNMYDDMLLLMVDYEGITEYVLTPDITFQENKTYYELVNNEYVAYDGDTSGNPNQLGLYQSAFPMTVNNYFSTFLNKIGCTTDITSLPNGSRIMTEDVYKGISYTNRDVLDDLGQANAILFKNENNVIKKVTKGTTTKVVNDDILKNQNISMGEHYGPINTIVLSRSADTDNVYYPDPLPANPIEFKISDNQLMNGNDRSDYLPAIYEALNGLEYDIYDCELTGFGGFEPLDKVQIETVENNVTKTYNSFIFNNDVKIAQGYDESIYNDLPEKTQTNFKYASPTDKAIREATIIVDKKLAEIDIKGKTINLTADNIKIESDNFSVDEDGNITANGGKIANITITPTGLKYVMKPGHNFTSTDVEKIANYLAGLGTLTPEELTLYDVNNDGEVDITDLVIVGRVVSIGVTNDNPLVFEIVHDPSNLENILQSGIKFYVEGGRNIFSANGYGVSIPQDVLFEDSQGNNGTIPLADVYSHDYMEVFGVDNNGRIGAYAKVPYPEEGEYFVVSVMESNGSNTYIRRTRYTMTNNTLVPADYGYVRINGSSVTTATDRNYIYITKVVNSRW